MKLQESSMLRIPVKNYFKECSQFMLMQSPTKAKGTYIYICSTSTNHTNWMNTNASVSPVTLNHMGTFMKTVILIIY